MTKGWGKKNASFRSRRVETQRPGSRKQRIGVGDTGANKFPPTYTFPSILDWWTVLVLGFEDFQADSHGMSMVA